MTEYAAIDIGASSGRVVLGRLAGGVMALHELHRFPNRPVRLPDGLRWNLLQLFTEAVGALRGRSLEGVGADTWGVDYALLDERGRVLGMPFHYRDDRTDGMVERAFARVPQADQYAVTGIQTLPINTIFQLLAEEGAPALADAHAIALVPDLLAHWLSGELANERTNASTTALLDARSGEWAHGLIGRLGLPARPFGELVEPGTQLVVRDEHSAILSSGTWSLLGVELPAPVLSDMSLSNERGVDGTIRLLKNVMGLWLEQECARAWDVPFPELHRLALGAGADVPLFDPDQDELLKPGDMPERIVRACTRTRQPAPAGRGEIVRSIFVSLACKYRLVLERLEAASGREVRTIHVIGGGARNVLLCRLTADLTGREVLAGPVEAAALGNVLVQARGAGELGSLADIRAVVAASAAPIPYEPSLGRDDADATFQRFLDVTGLAAPTIASTGAVP